MVSEEKIQPSSVDSGPDSLLCHRTLEELFWTFSLIAWFCHRCCWGFKRCQHSTTVSKYQVWYLE